MLSLGRTHTGLLLINKVKVKKNNTCKLKHLVKVGG